MPESQILAENLQKIREERNETQLDFALNCGLSVDEISKLENMKTDPKLSTLQNIAAYTNLTVAQLLLQGNMTAKTEEKRDVSLQSENGSDR